MAAFNEEVRNDLNNLPGFPREEDFKLGDVLNTWGVPDPTTLNQATSKTIYVETPANGGSDETGDGESVATAFATPQKAWDTVARLAGPGPFIVQCGEGTFDAPVLDKPLAHGTYCFFVGARDDSNAETIVFPSAPSFSAVSPSSVRLRANIGAYGFTINSTTHWVEYDYGSPFPPWGGPCLDSASPNLDVTSIRFGNTGGVAVRPFLTTFRPVVGNAFAGSQTAYYPVPYQSGDGDLIGYVGIQFDGLGNQRFDNVALFGCYTAQSALLKNCLFDSAGGGFFVLCEGVSSLGAAVTASGFNFQGNGLIGNRADFLYTEGLVRIQDGYLTIDNVDFNDVGNLCVQVNGGRLDWSSGANVQLSGSISRFLQVLRNSSVIFNSGVAVNGTVSGNGVEIERNSSVEGLEAAANGNLTAGGSEIVVGGNAGATFASLPANDGGAANPQFCSAT